MLFLPNSAGIAITSDATETAITALNGTRSLFTRRNTYQPGIARSRENAYQVREALVRPAMPQNSWPMVQMSSTAFAAAELSDVVIIGIDPPPAVEMAFTCVDANISARSTNQPAIAEKKIE